MEYMEYKIRKKWVPNIPYIQKPMFKGFLTHFLSFSLVLLVLSYVLCFPKFNFDEVWKMRNSEYGINWVSNFAKVLNLEKSVFCRALKEPFFSFPSILILCYDQVIYAYVHGPRWACSSHSSYGGPRQKITFFKHVRGWFHLHVYAQHIWVQITKAQKTVKSSVSFFALLGSAHPT